MTAARTILTERPTRLILGAIRAVLLLLALMPITPRAQIAPPLREGKFSLTDQDRAYWAFQQVQRPPIPKTKSGKATPHPIDAFLLANLEEKKLTISPPATPREQVRRAYFDLVGLPPSPEEVQAFERNPTDAAWDQLIDRLLASPGYGERWGRHWLDLVRYAESNGYERDGAKPQAWRYRDYVIAAFNDDKPYDRFIREQLAGDELVERLPEAQRLSPEWREALIATGFYRLHVWDDEPDSTVAAEFDDLDDIMVTTGTAFLGLTIGCARCHDHKYDPISQADYYSLLSFFRSIDPYGLHKTGGGGRGTGKIGRWLAAPEELQQWENSKKERVNQLRQRIAQNSEPEAKKKLETELKQAEEAAPPFDFALGAVENGPKAKPTHLLARGDANSPRAEVFPAFPAVFGQAVPVLAERSAEAASTGRRLALADWMASPENPLTARVMMNRLWQSHFGAGIVPTPDDFGRTGLRPSNQPLLDYLAAEFVAGGWRLKRMHKLVMTSQAYRMTSRGEQASGQALDEGNALFWRQNLRRLDAEGIRDLILAVSGALNLKRGGPSVFPELPREVHGTQDSSRKGWADSPPEERNRRSVYLVVKRGLKVPFLECFDFANSASASGTRPVTTTALQALMLLNDSFIQEQGGVLADRLIAERESLDPRIERAFQRVLQRAPSRTETTAARHLLSTQEQQAAVAGLPDPAKVALKSFCRGLLNLNESIYLP